MNTKKSWSCLKKKIQSGQFSAISAHSKKVIPGSLFVALKGQQHDGHSYLKSAIQKGAKALVVENQTFLKNLSFSGLVCLVKSTRKALPILLNHFYNSPSEKMFCTGITGTNGKTTVSHMMAFLFTQMGWHTGLIGSIVNRLKNWEEKSTLTTPDNVTLHNLINRFYTQGAKALVMEASSIGLDQQRTAGVDFNLGIWTNLSQDHLDYHPSFADYFSAKKKLFDPSLNPLKKNHFQAIINLDDSYGIQLAQEINHPYMGFYAKPPHSKKNPSSQKHLSYKILSSDLSGSYFQVYFQNQIITGFLPMLGPHNVYNAIGSLCGVYSAGFDLAKAVKALKDFPGVPGRLQKVSKPSMPLVFVDYAHTPHALATVLSFLKQNKKPHSQIYTVFGCGGDREHTKRPIMGQSAEAFSDKVFLTSDNPRGENPHNIIKDILKGIKNKQKVTVEINRKQAIYTTLSQAKKTDIVLIAGKGHETKQILKNKTHYFNDADIVKKYYSDHA